jgi:hypothetical protein
MVEEVAPALGVTDNAVRAQLLGLERDGFVPRSGFRPGERRPSPLYRLTPEAERRLPKPYAPLLRRLMDVLAQRLPPAILEAVLRESGRRTGAEYGPVRGSMQARLGRAADLLPELGGIAAGIIGGLLAAVFGLVDWLAIPSGTRAKRIGLLHGVGNVIVVLMFAASWWLRMASPRTPGALALTLSFAGLALALVTGWLGGELVDRLGVGVDEGAHINAPSSLSSRRAVRS